ncbi:MAG TPA: hypothetical protein VFX49_22580 [Chloroflexota bacterium]|nr:hypothetical protein [Chloroflexota bacterium]
MNERGRGGGSGGHSRADGPGGVVEALLRRSLLVVAALAAAGTAIELAMLRHWKSGMQLVPWVVLAVLLTAIGLVAMRPSRGSVRVARGVAVAAVLASLVGMYEHVEANYESGPLDYRYTESWASMPEGARWWAALSKTVGPAPPIAPGVLSQASLALLLATLRHESLRRA